MKRYSILAKIREGDANYFYLNFDDNKILECLKKVPPQEGLIALTQWPIHKPTEIEFFLELINGNIVYYHLKDLSTNIKRTVYLDKTY